MARVMRRIPITRVSDLTPLDRMRQPVFSVVTPLARDLTVHMGKGLTSTAARVSALMEAVERVSAESIPSELIVRASYESLCADSGVVALDPVTVDLPSDSTYRPDRVISWAACHDLVSQEAILVPVDLLVNPPVEGVLRDVDTNGLASGNTLLEAVIHGLCEVIERDAFAQLEFVSLFGDPEDPPPFTPPVDITSLPDVAATLVEQLRREDLDVLVHDVTSDVGVATFRSVILDHGYPGPEGRISVRFPGWGCAAHAKEALLRSLSESVQARMGYIQGARDSFNTTLLSPRSATRARDLRTLLSEPSTAFASVPSFEAEDLRDELRFLMNRLLDAGLKRIVVCDLTRKDLDIPVVRVRVPGLSSFYVNRRRVGWRCLRHLL